MPRQLLFSSFVYVLALLFVGCDSGMESEEGRIVAGVDLEEVFAPESTLALIAGRANSGRAHHSSQPMVVFISFCSKVVRKT